MLDMSKKNRAGPPRAGSAAAVREAARTSTPLARATSDQPKRRSFSAEYKQRILREADAARASGVAGAIGTLLRREGLYSSRLFEWRQQREAGQLAGLTPSKRGRKASRSAQTVEVEQLQRRVSLLETVLKKAAAIIDVQKASLATAGREPDGPNRGGVRPRRHRVEAVMAGLAHLIPLVGIVAACSALCVSRASFYRTKLPPKPRQPRPRPRPLNRGVSSRVGAR